MWFSVGVVFKKIFVTIFSVLISCCVCVTLSSDFEPGGKPEIKLINPDAEAIIGAVVNVRERGSGLFGCGERRSEGVVAADALKWLIDELNSKIWSGSSSNVSLGLQIMDSCGRTRTAASQLIDFLPELQNNENSSQENIPFKFCIIDDIGLSKEPDISKSLEDINVAAVDTNINTNSPQVLINAILLFIQELRWEHTAIVHSNSRFSSSMLKQFIKTLKKFDLCVPWVVNVEDDDEDELHNVLQSGVPILSLLPTEEHPKFLKSFKEPTNIKRRVSVVFSDSVTRNQLAMISSSSLQIFSVIPIPEKEISFENFYSKNSIINGVRVEDELDLVQRTKIVRKIKKIGENLSESLRSAMLKVCHEKQRLCSELVSVEGRRSILDVLGTMTWSNNDQSYELVEYRYQFLGEHVHLLKIMAYNGHKNLDIFETNISYTDINCEDDNESKVECRCLEVTSARSGSGRNIDDWEWKKQKPSKYSFEKEKRIPVAAETQPVDQQLSKPMVFGTLNDPLNGTLACLTLLGGLITLVIAQYFATFAALPNGGFTSGTTVIGFVILIGLFLLFSTNLSFLLTPSIPMCTLRRFCPSFSYAMIFSGMLIKVWTTLRQISSTKAVLWKQVKLIIYSGAFSFFQFLPTGLWLLLKPPATEFVDGRWICYPSASMDTHLIISMIYPILLLLITLILAIRTCSKSNIDEVRWILISSSLSGIIFCCWGMAIATGVWQTHRTVSTNLAIGTILMLCLYVPKIKTHSEFKKSLKSQTSATPDPVEVDKECPVFTPSPPFPVVMGYNVVTPVLPKEVEPNYLNEAYSNDESSETLSTPFDLDSSTYSEIDQEPPHTFSTFLEDPQVPKLEENETTDDPTQVIPSALYPIEMFNNEPVAVTSDHCQPGTNEFTPPHRATSQLYLCPQPEWVP